ncbi:MAG: AAA family ATPase, partial [Actinomycetota bacterium]|nr:AAA family ATPase [Actinomycetota bacterium]
MRQARSADIYAAATRWVGVALRGNGSLFSPGESIWSSETIDDLYQRYNLRPDTSSGAGIDAKLRRQLEGAPDTTIQLMAEVTFM